jgi:hypothetical protein
MNNEINYNTEHDPKPEVGKRRKAS